jgi:hypothetical protein
MLEYWNDGIMGSGKMGHWIIGKISLDGKGKNDIFGQKTNIPIFHHSGHSGTRQKSNPQNPIHSISCRISETSK